MLAGLWNSGLHGQKSEAVENRMQQPCWDNIVQCCRQYCSAVTPDCGLIQAQQYCSILLTTRNNIVASCFKQPVRTHNFSSRN